VGGQAEAQVPAVGLGARRVVGEGGGRHQDVGQRQRGDAAVGEREAGGGRAGGEQEVESVQTWRRRQPAVMTFDPDDDPSTCISACAVGVAEFITCVVGHIEVVRRWGGLQPLPPPPLSGGSPAETGWRPRRRVPLRSGALEGTREATHLRTDTP